MGTPAVNVTPLVWIITIAVTIAFFVYEFYAHVRKPHEDRKSVV